MKLLLIIFLLPFTSTPIGYRELKWSDFKGKPTNDHAASTCTGIVIEKDTAYAIFEPEKSWTRTANPATLRHEQVHFAITREYAILISNQLKYGWGFEYISKTLDEWGDKEMQYDKQTDHGRDSTAQRRWEEQIKL